MLTLVSGLQVTPVKVWQVVQSPTGQGHENSISLEHALEAGGSFRPKR